MRNLKFLMLALIGILLASCANDDDAPQQANNQGEYSNGIYLINEGNFNGGNGSISFIDQNFASITNGVYSAVNNGLELGDVAQSATFYGDKIYIVVNNSNRIVIANRYSMEMVGSIETNLRNPRYMAVVGTKGYVTNWGEGTDPSDDFVAVIDLATDSYVSSIPVNEGPEKIVTMGNNLYVLHAGGFSQGNSLSVISSSSDTVSETITIGDVPQSFVVQNNQLWVLCRGKNGNDFITPTSAASLWQIDDSATMVADFSGFESVPFQHASDLNIVETQVYLQVKGKGVYSFGLGSFAAAEQLIDENFYLFSAAAGKLIGLDAVDFVSAGKASVYNFNGELENEFTTGVVPTFVLAQP